MSTIYILHIKKGSLEWFRNLLASELVSDRVGMQTQTSNFWVSATIPQCSLTQEVCCRGAILGRASQKQMAEDDIPANGTRPLRGAASMPALHGCPDSG